MSRLNPKDRLRSDNVFNLIETVFTFIAIAIVAGVLLVLIASSL